MKNTFKVFAAAVIIAASVFTALSLAGCDDNSTSSGGGEWVDPDALPTAERWSSWYEPSSTATITHSVASDDICTITVGGTAMPPLATDGILSYWNSIWFSVAEYRYTAVTGKTYTYTFEAWTDKDEHGNNVDRAMNVQYWYEEDNARVYESTGYSWDGDHHPPLFTINSTRQTYIITGTEPIPKSGVQGLRFQCANQLGTFYVKIISIKEEHTDVVYSEDGSRVTLYLDGVGVPVTKAQRSMSRAMSANLAMMAYDYLEVVFIDGSNIVRAAWEKGQPAGITGVSRGVDYAAITKACLFVGRKDYNGGTLLGVGKLTDAAPFEGTDTTINNNTKTVTFSISAIQTGLLVGSETIGGGNPVGAVADSFTYTAGGADGYTARTITNSYRVPLGSTSYPLYSLPTDTTTGTAIVNATYTFSFVGNTADYLPAIKHIDPTATYLAPSVVQKRVPRYIEGGLYLIPKKDYVDDTTTKIEFRDNYATTANTNFVNVVPLVFTTNPGSGGIFSFYLEIPVYMVTDTPSNVGIVAERWRIRTGLGSQLYSLDDGQSSGGCVLMGVGISPLNWSEIQWEGLN